MATKPPPDAFYSRRAEGDRLHASGMRLVYNRQYDTRESPQVNQKNHTSRWASGLPVRLRRLGGGTPFVARRAVNLHGCAPRSSYSGGTPGSAYRPGVGRFTSLRPPPAATPPDPLASPATQATEGFSMQVVRQGGVTLRCRRFRGTFLEVVGTLVGGVSLAHKPQPILARCRRKPIMAHGPVAHGIADPPRAGGVPPRGRGGAVGGGGRGLRRGAIPLPGRPDRDLPGRSGRRFPPAGGRGRGSTPRSTPSRRPASFPPFWRPSVDSGTRGPTR
jgi:hypothetical protein